MKEGGEGEGCREGRSVSQRDSVGYRRGIVGVSWRESLLQNFKGTGARNCKKMKKKKFREDKAESKLISSIATL